jgi:hypothetical protein
MSLSESPCATISLSALAAGKYIAIGDQQVDQRCGFEVAGDAAPYRGARGQGRATLSGDAGPVLLLRLIDRYLQRRDSAFAQWLIARREYEVAIRIEPQWLTSWDYSARMSI